MHACLKKRVREKLFSNKPGKKENLVCEIKKVTIKRGAWETCLAPGWPQLRSGLPFGEPGAGGGGQRQGRGHPGTPQSPLKRSSPAASSASLSS